MRLALINSFAEHRRRYGSRRLLSELQEQGYAVGRHQLRRLMKAEGLQAIQPRSIIPRTTDSRHGGPFSPNLLLTMEFPTAPGSILVGDITYIPLAGSEWGYLAAWTGRPRWVCSVVKLRVGRWLRTWKKNWFTVHYEKLLAQTN